MTRKERDEQRRAFEDALRNHDIRQNGKRGKVSGGRLRMQNQLGYGARAATSSDIKKAADGLGEQLGSQLAGQLGPQLGEQVAEQLRQEMARGRHRGWIEGGIVGLITGILVMLLQRALGW